MGQGAWSPRTGPNPQPISLKEMDFTIEEIVKVSGWDR
jgi:hypothetical protein